MAHSNPFHNVLVLGATGDLGRRITESFLDKKTFHVSILIRPGNKDEKKLQTIEHLKTKGAVVVEADPHDSASLKKALHGIDLVVSALNGPSIGDQIAIAQAAKEAGVKRFVPSEYGIDVEVPKRHGHEIAILSGKIAVRDELRKLQLEHVFVSTGLFYEYLLFITGINLENPPAFPGTGKEKFGTTSIVDIARLLPDIVTHPDAANKTVLLYGAFISADELYGYVEEVTEKKLPRQYISAEEYQKIVEAEKDPRNKFIAQLKHAVALGIFGNDHPNYHELTQEKPQPLREYLLQTLKK